MIYDATRFMLHHREQAGMETWHLYYECDSPKMGETLVIVLI